MYRDLSQLLAAERVGKVRSKWRSGTDEGQIVRDAVKQHVRALGARAHDVSAHLLRLALPCERPGGGSGAPIAMQEIRRPLDESMASGLRRLAARHQLTLNAIFLGALAALLHDMSGQREFAIMQTYLAVARPARYSWQLLVLSPMAFSFEDRPALLALCRRVLAEQRMLAVETLPQSEQRRLWHGANGPPCAAPVLLDVSEGRAAVSSRLTPSWSTSTRMGSMRCSLRLEPLRAPREEMVSAWCRCGDVCEGRLCERVTSCYCCATVACYYVRVEVPSWHPPKTVRGSEDRPWSYIRIHVYKLARCRWVSLIAQCASSCL